MNRTIALCALLCWITFCAVTTISAPDLMSDHNEFLKGFVNHEFLNFMGIIVTITLASAGNLFVEFVRYEREWNEPTFENSKRDVRHSAFALIGALVVSLIVVTTKPLVGATALGQNITNDFALSIILFSVLILSDLTLAAFKLDPHA